MLFLQYVLVINLQKQNSFNDDLAWNCLYSLNLTTFNVKKCNGISRTHKYQLFLLESTHKSFPLCSNKLSFSKSIVLNIIQ